MLQRVQEKSNKGHLEQAGGHPEDTRTRPEEAGGLDIMWGGLSPLATQDMAILACSMPQGSQGYTQVPKTLFSCYGKRWGGERCILLGGAEA